MFCSKLKIISVCFFFCIVTVPTSYADFYVIPVGKSVQVTEKTIHFNLPPSAFVTSLFRNVNYIAGEWIMLTSAQSTGLAAPLQLPDDALVTDFTCYVYDNHPTYNVDANSPTFLWKRELNSLDRVTFAEIDNLATSGASTDIQSFSAPSIDSSPIDNSQYAYGAYSLYKLTESSSSNEIRFYGCKLTYTLTVVTP